MGGFNIIDSFSYNWKDRDVIVKAKKAAKDLDLSFSEYIVRCIKADVGEVKSQKKEMGQEVSHSPIKVSDTEQNEQEEYKVDVPAINGDRRDIMEYIKSIADTSELGQIQGNGKFMSNMSARKLQVMRVDRVR